MSILNADFAVQIRLCGLLHVMSFHWACAKIHWLNLEDKHEQLMLFSALKYTYETDERVCLFICESWTASTAAGTIPCKDIGGLG